ncbi:unnamed protein product [Closterium sp. NIES-54]
MAGPDERGGRGAGGSGEAQAQGQPRDSVMAPVQPNLGPPRDEPRMFGLDNMTPRADLLTELKPSLVNHVTSALGQRAEVKGMGKAMFKGADGKMVGLKNMLWVPNLAANLIFVRRLQKAGIYTSSKGAKTFTARIGERVFWDLHMDRGVYNEIWQILVVPMPKERQVAASVSTKCEAVGSGYGANGGAKAKESNKCKLGGTSKQCELEESGAAAKDQHKGEENPKAAAEEEYGESMWGTIASAAFSNPTSAAGECDWLTLHWRMGHVDLPILQKLVKNEMVAGIRMKQEPDEVLGCPTCMQAKFTRFLFSSSEETAKVPHDEVVMDVVGPLKLGAAGAEYFLTIVDVYTHMTWVYVQSKKSDVAETVKTVWLPMVEWQQDRLVKAIRTDRGGEFLSKEFSLWLEKNGIRHSLTMPYSPEMNGIAERANRTITESAHRLLIETGLPDNFWPDAVRSPCVQRQGFHVPAVEEEARGKRRIQAPNRLTYDAPGKPAKSALAGAALMVGDDEEYAFVIFSPVEMPGEPATLKEALESSDAEEWKKAMESELKSIVENGTWELVELPEGRKAITSKWLFKIKSDADGKIERYKSRIPEGFDDGSGRVWKLKKALYVLKQAPMQRYLKLREVLEEIGFTPSSADHSLFMLGEREQRNFMVVYEDDILIFSPFSDLVKEVMLKLQDKFKCKAFGDVSFYLGLHIERDVERRCMRVHQRKYLEALAANFGQIEGHVATPFPSGFKCVKGPEEESVGEEERRHFHSLVGSLMYAAVNTRPDVAFATGQLARVVQCPNEEQVAVGIRMAKYLGQTAMSLLRCLSYASEQEDMTTVGAFICCVGGGLTSWKSKKQVDQALSSVESKYMALFRAVREIVWQRRLLAELGEEQQGPTPLYSDSQGAISLAKNPVLHGLAKHMMVKWHSTRSMVAAGEVELHYVKTTRQPADMMTKRLVEQQH